ncbi:MAG TPA: tetratricopeptide repeat protein [Terriglobales bacterium]
MRLVHVTACVVVATAFAMPQESDWQSVVRSEVARKNLDGAAAMVDGRLAANPGDLEARAWRARLLAWRGRWAEAESEYRHVLEQAPADAEVMAGLADVLTWQGKLDKALRELDRARTILPLQSFVLDRRARLLERLGRRQEARAEYTAALRLDPNDRAARVGLQSLSGERRHELRFGVDIDTFNYTDAAAAQSVVLISRWNSNWTTTVSSTTYQRFGADAERLTARVSRRVGKNWFAAGGGAGHDQGVIPRREFALEYGRGFRIGDRGLVRGVEFSFSPQWFWYRDSSAMTLTSAAIFYLPRDWMWSLTVVAARSSFPIVGAQWQPSGNTRLSFPLRSERLRGNISFGVGTENFAVVDQVGRFSARTFAGGLKYQINARQDIGGYVAYQARSQQRTQTSVGFSYGIRF